MKSLLKAFAYSLMFIFFDVEFEGSLYILDTSPLLNICFTNTLSHVHGSSLHFLNGVFQGEEAIDFGEVQVLGPVLQVPGDVPIYLVQAGRTPSPVWVLALLVAALSRGSRLGLV